MSVRATLWLLLRLWILAWACSAGVESMDFNTVIAGIIALVIICTAAALILLGRPIPELLSNLAFGVFGFYFRGITLPKAEKTETPPVPTQEKPTRGAATARTRSE